VQTQRHGSTKAQREVKIVWVSVLIMMLIAGCYSAREDLNPGIVPDKFAALRSVSLSLYMEDTILALDPNNITAKDIAEVLSKSPAPHIFNLNGSVPIVTMEPFSKFLIAMGYPEEKVRNPESGEYYYSSHVSSSELAGKIAWHYEKEGMMPIVIGHSQGGMMAVKVLHELAGTFDRALYVVNPATGAKEDRHTIVDPLSGLERPVKGLSIGFASAIATGKFMRFLLGQWNMIPLLRKIPDTADEFTGYHIPFDFIGGDVITFGKGKHYYASGSANVRNVMLPSDYKHISIPETGHLAENKSTRDWINNYKPFTPKPGLDSLPEVNTRNIIFAADIWYSIKKNWCIQLQQLITAKKKLSKQLLMP